MIYHSFISMNEFQTLSVHLQSFITHWSCSVGTYKYIGNFLTLLKTGSLQQLKLFAPLLDTEKRKYKLKIGMTKVHS